VLKLRIEFNKEVGALVINLGTAGKNTEVLESTALVLITISGGKIVDIEILFSDKKVVEKLDEIFQKR